jgi:hypothetical protein
VFLDALPKIQKQYVRKLGFAHLCCEFLALRALLFACCCSTKGCQLRISLALSCTGNCLVQGCRLTTLATPTCTLAPNQGL